MKLFTFVLLLGLVGCKSPAFEAAPQTVPAFSMTAFEVEWESERARRETLWTQKLVLARPKGSPPPIIVVYPYIVKVQFTTDESLALFDAQALTLWEKKEIWLRYEQDPDELRDDLLHEIMHICQRNKILAAPAYSLEEEFVEKGTPTLLSVLQDNPELVQWLQRRKTRK